MLVSVVVCGCVVCEHDGVRLDNKGVFFLSFNFTGTYLGLLPGDRVALLLHFHREGGRLALSFVFLGQLREKGVFGNNGPLLGYPASIYILR